MIRRARARFVDALEWVVRKGGSIFQIYPQMDRTINTIN